jgi:L-alanine-DL-glutamate epimerase-like enolase superfamily enzyme
MNKNKIEIQSDGMIQVPERPGLGIDFDTETIKKYLVDVEIKVSGKTLYKSPNV